MKIELEIEDRRLLLQGIWKELTMYQGIIDKSEANDIALKHANNMQKRLWILEEKMLGHTHIIGKP
jgi:hypothetical protein